MVESKVEDNMDKDLPCKEIALLVGHQGPVRSVRFNADGNYCMTCGSDKLVKLWNPHREGGKFLKSYGGHGYEVLDVTASGDSGRLASCSADRTVVLWDVSTGQVIRRYRGHIAKVNAVKFNQPDSTMIMSASYDATVRCWDTRSRNQDPIQIIDDAKDSIPTLQVSQHEILTGSVDCKVRNYDIRMGSLVVDFLGEPVTSVAFSQDHQCVLSSTLDSTIRLLDKETGELLNEFKGHKNNDYKVDSCFTNTDTHIISGSEDGSIFFWDLIEAKVVHTIDKAHRSVCYSLSYHPKEACMITASSDGAVKVWRAMNWEPE